VVQFCRVEALEFYNLVGLISSPPTRHQFGRVRRLWPRGSVWSVGLAGAVLSGLWFWGISDLISLNCTVCMFKTHPPDKFTFTEVKWCASPPLSPKAPPTPPVPTPNVPCACHRRGLEMSLNKSIAATRTPRPKPSQLKERKEYGRPTTQRSLPSASSRTSSTRCLNMRLALPPKKQQPQTTGGTCHPRTPARIRSSQLNPCQNPYLPRLPSGSRGGSVGYT
jgi:hypothetical protein